MLLWRISKFADLTGRGGLLVDGRWHRKGSPVVYCCDHPSTALLEVLVHMDRARIPSSYRLLQLEVPDEIEVFNGTSAGDVTLTTTEATGLFQRRRRAGEARVWDDATSETLRGVMNAPMLPMEISQSIGSFLLQKKEVALVRVRSAVMPHAWNYLINPQHSGAERIAITETFEYPFDSRLLV
ncbi:RES family NAD+ phosphorylase [Pseudomonas sp. R2.Fl]|nr:RES family NAD+ phosphorylase [Pseudomonas sp. R2.Fl]